METASAASHASERDELLLRLPHPARRRSAARSTPSTPSAAWWTTASTRRGAGEKPALERWLEEVGRCYRRCADDATSAGTSPGPCRASRFRGAASRRSSKAAAWTWTTSATRRFADLRLYCRRVASAVGLATIEIFGYTNPATRDYAEELGLALQLTNILRDVGVDAERGRIYVPLEDLARFGVGDLELLAAARGAAPPPAGLGRLLAFEAERAREPLRREPGSCFRPRTADPCSRPRSWAPSIATSSKRSSRQGFPLHRTRRASRGRGRRGSPLRTVGARDVRRMRVVVVGGGFAGLAAAIALQERRHDVLLLERRGVLGGRATSYRDAVSGDDVDNGTHLMVGAYRATLDLIRRAGAEDLLLVQENLRLDYVDDRGFTSLDCPPLAAPLHLLAGLLGLRVPVAGAPRRAPLRPRRALRPPGPTGSRSPSTSGAPGSRPRRDGCSGIPSPSRSSTRPPERAAAILFCNVYREAFLADRRASRLVFLRRGYAALHERLGRYLEARGGAIRRRALVDAIEVEDGRVTGVRYAQRAEAREEIQRGKSATAERVVADAVVVAAPWHAVASLAPRGVAVAPSLRRALGPRRVADRIDRDVAGPDRRGPSGMVGLRDSEVEWVFDKGRLHGRDGAPQHLAFIVSAAYRSTPRPNAELVAAAEASLRRYFPGNGGRANDALPRDARGRGDLRLGPGRRGASARQHDADPWALPRRRLDRHGTAGHDRRRRPQRSCGGSPGSGGASPLNAAQAGAKT